MSIDAFYKAIELLTSAGLKMDQANPVQESDVVACEKSIKAKLPSSYREFLKTYGYGGSGGIEFSGLLAGSLDEDHPVNAYAVTKELHNNFSLPEDHFAFRDFDGDAVACLLLSSLKDGECKVVLWDHSESPESQVAKPYVLAESFGHYFLKLVKDKIDDLGNI